MPKTKAAGQSRGDRRILRLCFPSAVSKHVDALVRKGFLLHDREKRNIKVSEAVGPFSIAPRLPWGAHPWGHRRRHAHSLHGKSRWLFG